MVAIWKNYICNTCATTVRTPPGRELIGPCPVCNLDLNEVKTTIRPKSPDVPGGSNTQHF